jgi:hypothetical protein
MTAPGTFFKDFAAGVKDTKKTAIRRIELFNNQVIINKK